MNRNAVAASLLSLAVLAACADRADAPLAPQAARREAAQNGRTLVAFNNRSAADVGAAVAARGGTLEYYHEGTGIAIVGGLTTEAAQALPGAAVAAAEETVQLDPVAGVETEEATGVAEPQSPTAPNTAFFFPRQWHHRAIHANTAWAAGRTGSAGVTVAILDTGIDYGYPDLVGRVDLSRSVSFVPSDPIPAGFHPVLDRHYHGTHVASTVASNGNVVAGVTSRVTLIGVKVLGASGSGSNSGVLQGLIWAADHGADVANMSLGSYFTKAGNGSFIGLVQRVLNYAHRKGMLVVVSAGNSAIDLDHDGNGMTTFCSFANVVCVSATGPTASASVNGPFTNVDALAGYSNYGRSAINVAAPGGNQRPVWEACNRFSLALPVCGTGTFTLGLSGTSMASPHVAGLAALIVEDVGHGNPAQVKARLQQSADDLGAIGTDPFYGKGRINVARALGL
ncbi:MAG TPA: S8 family serine peptidase [Longimicrobium sp.]|nr:S8 family serine peptidase [Longimicrobium sp.]